MGFMDEPKLTLYDGLMKTYIEETTVAKEDGKGLSTNDYTTPEKNIVSKLGESDDNNLTFNGKKISAAQMTGATADTDGTSGTVVAPKAGDQMKFYRGDGTWAEASGGGTKISPKATVNPAITSGNTKCTISWGDPEDVIADGVILSTWKGTKLVMNETGYPEDENDGTVLVDNKVKDAYVSTGYEVTGLTNGNTYYFKLFPYSTDGIYNYQDSNKLLGNPSLVKLDPCTNMNVTLAMGSATVKWNDPASTKTVDGVTATWAKTVLVYKQGSTAPLSISDGTVAVEESTQNQYSTDGFEVTGLTDGQEYTFALFAISMENSVSDTVSASVQLWATLNIITTETTLYGKDVTVTNDTSTVTGTFSDTGSVTLSIPWIGATTITATDGTETGDDAIDITAYMTTYSLQFSFVPDGETVTPVDDVKTLVKCAGISGNNYTTIAEVLADDEVMSAITMDENSMKYLARSTGFADEVCADETFMTYLGASAYVDSTVLNSDLWVSNINFSSYWDLIYPSVMVHSSSSATITVAGKTFTSDATGNTQHSMPWGTFSVSDSVSGQSFECTIDRDTTDVYVMPVDALYWYGNKVQEIDKWYSYSNTTFSEKTNYLSISTKTGASSPMGTTEIIDLNKYDSVHFIANINALNEAYGHCFISTKQFDNNNSIYSIGKQPNVVKYTLLETTTTDYVINCSELNDSYYLGVFGSNRVINLYALWIE